MPDFYGRMQFEGVVKTVYTDYTQDGGKRAEAKAYTDPLTDFPPLWKKLW